MKKTFASLLIALTLGVGANAQTLERGDQTINLGFGFDPYYSHSSWNGSKKSAVGPIVLGYEYIVTEKLGIGRIGVGGILGQTFYGERYTNNNNSYQYKYNRNRTAILARAAYHFDIPKAKGLDLYAGVGAGLYFLGTKETIDFPNGNVDVKKSSTVNGAHYVFAGVRYFFTDAFGIYLEAGHGFSAVNGGISFKF